MESTQTLVYVISLVAGLYLLTWVFIGIPMRVSTAASTRFALANFFVVIGILLTLRRVDEQSYLAYPIADILLVIGFTGFRSGLQKLTHLKETLVEDASVIVLMIIAYSLVTPSMDSIVTMSTIFSVSAAWVTARALFESYRSLNSDFNVVVRLFLSSPFFICTVVLVMRSVVLIGFPESAHDVANIYTKHAEPFLWSQLILLLLVNLTVGGIAIGELFMKIRELAERDPLTGVWNRRAIEARLRSERERFCRTGDHCALAMLDLDHFKNINDKLGHDGGDAALIHVSKLVRECLRQMDSLGRFGGEEFLVVMPMTDVKGAAIIAERIRHTLEVSPLMWKEKPVVITTSIGLASMATGDHDFSQMCKRADEALYHAKANGRNRVEVADVLNG